MPFFLIQFFAVLFIVAASPAKAVTPIDCPTPLPWAGEEAGTTYDCGVVTVPENYDAPDGRTIDLVYLRLKASTLSPRPDPMIYLSGGPGSSALHEISVNQLLYQNMQATRARRDVVFFDQRGTGHSHFLSCAPFSAAIGVVSELFADLLPEETLSAIQSIDDQDRQVALMMGVCAASYKAAGADLSQINSVASAKDIASLASALGYTDDYNLYGTSYGTRLAQNALRSTPERIRAVVLDGTVSPGHSGTGLTVAKVQGHYDTLFRLCAEDPACSDRFPNARDRFIAVLKQLADEPYVFDPPVVGSSFMRSRFPIIERIDPAFFGSFGVLNNNAGQGGFAALVPMIVEALEQDDETRLRMIFGGAKPPGPQIDPLPTAAEIVKPDDLFFAPALDIILARSIPGGGNGIGGDFMVLLLDDLKARLFAGEPQAEVVKDFVDLSVLPFASPDRASLATYVEDAVTDANRPTARAMLGAMSDEEVRQAFWAIGDAASMLDGSGGGRTLSFSTLIAVNCPEDIVFTPPGKIAAYADASPYPGVFVQTVEDYELMYAYCAFFPAPFEKDEMLRFVESDTPALIFQEGLDTQTPLFMGEEVAALLPNSIFLEWPSEGHVIAARSPDGCAGDIAAAFFDAPTVAPDMSCASAPYYHVPFGTLFGMVDAALAR